ncbi:MAG: hypothetical protein MZV64_50195 [Ignavibacteriales bacterium]|nr:hypothetical protein [Ignavibacteriales bacterium]
MSPKGTVAPPEATSLSTAATPSGPTSSTSSPPLSASGSGPATCAARQNRWGLFPTRKRSTCSRKRISPPSPSGSACSWISP